MLTIGGTDSEHCDSIWLEQKEVLKSERCYNGWCVSASSVSVGTATAQLARPAVIEMAFPSSVIDTSMYYEIVRELHAEYDSNADTYVVDCWLAGSAPEFMLNLATGGVISIPSSDYIAPLPGRNDVCQLLFTDSGGGYEEVSLNMGSVLFKSYCVRYDLNTQHLSFAKTITVHQT